VPFTGPASPPTHAGHTPPPVIDDGRRPRRRTHLPYVLGLVLLVPLTLWLEFALQEELDTATPNDAVTVGAKETAEYAGATWRITGVAEGPIDKDVRLPRDTALVYVGLSVTPRTEAASKRIEFCRFTASDGDDRVWNPAPSTIARYELLKDFATRCDAPGEDEYSRGPIPPGTSQKVVTAFLVPKDAVDHLRPRVIVEQASPRYLELVRATSSPGNLESGQPRVRPVRRRRVPGRGPAGLPSPRECSSPPARTRHRPGVAPLTAAQTLISISVPNRDEPVYADRRTT
jgi:hypothetical protein